MYLSLTFFFPFFLSFFSTHLLDLCITLTFTEYKLSSSFPVCWWTQWYGVWDWGKREERELMVGIEVVDLDSSEQERRPLTSKRRKGFERAAASADECSRWFSAHAPLTAGKLLWVVCPSFRAKLKWYPLRIRSRAVNRLAPRARAVQPLCCP